MRAPASPGAPSSPSRRRAASSRRCCRRRRSPRPGRRRSPAIASPAGSREGERGRGHRRAASRAARPTSRCRAAGSGSHRRRGRNARRRSPPRSRPRAPARIAVEGDRGRHVVEAERNRDRGRGRFVAGFVAEPDRERVGAGAWHRDIAQRGEARGRRRTWGRCRSLPGPVAATRRRAIGLAGPWSGFSQPRSKSSTRRQPSPPARARLRGCAGGLLSIRRVRAGVQLTLPAKSVAQSVRRGGRR